MVRGVVDDLTASGAMSMTGTSSTLRSRSASPGVRCGVPNAHAKPNAHNEAPAEQEDAMCAMYTCLTNWCWAKLIRLSERPARRELVDLQEKSLHALIKVGGATYGNDWRKPRLAKVLLDWMEEHPDQSLPLLLGHLREQQEGQAHRDSDLPP